METYTNYHGFTIGMMALLFSQMYSFNDSQFRSNGDLTSFKNFCMSNKARVKRIKNRRRK